MTDKKDDGGPAFPKAFDSSIPRIGGIEICEGQMGMSLRDYFAAHAPNPGDFNGTWGRLSLEQIVKFRFEYADAMIAESKK